MVHVGNGYGYGYGYGYGKTRLDGPGHAPVRRWRFNGLEILTPEPGTPGVDLLGCQAAPTQPAVSTK